VIPNKDSEILYTLKVVNDTEHPIQKLVLIDNLPEQDDHNAFDTNTARESEFKVELALNPDFNIRVIDPEGSAATSNITHTIEYSTGTDFGGPQSTHWKGEPSDDDDSTQWTSNPVGARSIRIVINGEILPDEVVEVTFKAKPVGEVMSGQTAWNSFGYHYKLEGYSDELEALSPKAGVRIPSIPKLVKKLVDTNGRTITAPHDTTFTFVLYEGTPLSGSFTDVQALRDALQNSGKKSVILNVPVNAGSSTSDPVALEFDQWNWEIGASYTISEFLTGDDYELNRFIETSARSCTFQYNPAVPQQITCENTLNLWSVRLKKVNEAGEALKGAVFGLYSPEASDERADAVPGIPAQVTRNGQKWYLADFGSSDVDGFIQWSGLKRECYYVQEIHAPDGYLIPTNGGMLLYRSASVNGQLDREVVNQAGYELPKTGSSGTAMYTISGLMVMVFALCLPVCVPSRKHKK